MRDESLSWTPGSCRRPDRLIQLVRQSTDGRLNVGRLFRAASLRFAFIAVGEERQQNESHTGRLIGVGEKKKSTSVSRSRSFSTLSLYEGYSFSPQCNSHISAEWRGRSRYPKVLKQKESGFIAIETPQEGQSLRRYFLWCANNEILTPCILFFRVQRSPWPHCTSAISD